MGPIQMIFFCCIWTIYFVFFWNKLLNCSSINLSESMLFTKKGQLLPLTQIRGEQ